MDSISKQIGGDVDGRRVYKDFEPSWDWVPEQDSDTLLLYLPGFKKEQLRVQLTRTRNLIISGERRLEDNTWSRFRKQFDVSKNCDTNAIGARFDAGVLYVKQPKLIITAEKQEDEKPTITEPPKPHMPMEEPQPQNNAKEQATSTQATGTRATSTANPPEPTNKKKDNEFEAAKSVSKKALEEREMEKKNVKESESADSKKSEGREERDAKGVGEKNLKEENESDKYARDGTGMSGGGTGDGDGDGDGDGSGKSMAETYRRAAGGVAPEVKMLRKVMNMALAVLMVLVLGMYIVKAIRSPAKVEN